MAMGKLLTQEIRVRLDMCLQVTFLYTLLNQDVQFLHSSWKDRVTHFNSMLFDEVQESNPPA